VPVHMNPADAFLDFVTGNTPSSHEDYLHGVVNVAAEWESRNPAPLTSSLETVSASSSQEDTPNPTWRAYLLLQWNELRKL
jgi:hypothetical protein